jgi:hypothetical protein
MKYLCSAHAAKVVLFGGEWVNAIGCDALRSDDRSGNTIRGHCLGRSHGGKGHGKDGYKADGAILHVHENLFSIEVIE